MGDNNELVASVRGSKVKVAAQRELEDGHVGMDEAQEGCEGTKLSLGAPHILRLSVETKKHRIDSLRIRYGLGDAAT